MEETFTSLQPWGRQRMQFCFPLESLLSNKCKHWKQTLFKKRTLTSCYSDLDWTHSVWLSLLLLSCSLCFSLAPWLRQMKTNDIGQAFSFYVLQCYLNSTKRHIYECHLLIYMYQCVLKSLFFFIVSLFFVFDLKGTCLNAMKDNNLDLQAPNKPKKYD